MTEEDLYLDFNDIENFDQYIVPEAERGKVVSPIHFHEGVVQQFFGDAKKGGLMPWSKTHDHIKFRDEEVTLVAGQNGSGKSALLTQMAIHFMRKDRQFKQEKVLIISPEMSPAQNLARIVRQATAKRMEKITDHDIGATMIWLSKAMLIYNHMGSIDQRTLVGVMRYAALELGVTKIIMDNMSVLKIKGDDLNRAQQEFISDMVAVSRDTGVHVFVVAHVRKPENKYARDDKWSIKGSGAISDLVDNVLLVRRHYKREDYLIHPDHDPLSDEYIKMKQMPTTFLEVAKQRHDEGWTGQFSLWFDPPTMRFSHEYRYVLKGIPEVTGFFEEVLRPSLRQAS